MKATDRSCFLSLNEHVSRKVKNTKYAIAKNTMILQLVIYACLYILGYIEIAYPFEAVWENEHHIADPKDAYVGPIQVHVPYETFILARKGNDYCAFRFLSYWEKKNGKERYATYESFYQGDGSADFSKANVKYRKGEVSDFGPGMFLGLFHTWGGELHLTCGPMKLLWIGGTKAAGIVFPRSDRNVLDGITELAPTPWTDISQVNATDPKIWWYQRDEKRWHLYIPLNELWNLPEKPEKLKFRPTQ